jgi:hypothetical protein
MLLLNKQPCPLYIMCLPKAHLQHANTSWMLCCMNSTQNSARMDARACTTYDTCTV